MATKSVARKHHYVPQAYLGSFTPSGSKEDQFFVMDVESGRSFRTSPANVAAQRDFNRVDIEGHSQDAVENALAPFEGDAIRAIRRVIETRTFPNDSDWNLILNLLALIGVRNPRLRKSFNRSREQSLRIMGDMLASDRNLWDRHVQREKESGEELPNVSFEEFKSFIERDNYRVEFFPEGNLRTEFNALDKVLPHLGQRTWSVLIAPPDGPEFVCSDHPVTLVWKDGRAGPVGYALQNTEVFFPLGRQVGFYGVYETPLNPVVHCRPLNVAIMNQRVVNNAERQVYSAVDRFHVWRQGSIQEVRCEV